MLIQSWESLSFLFFKRDPGFDFWSLGFSLFIFSKITQNNFYLNLRFLRLDILKYMTNQSVFGKIPSIGKQWKPQYKTKINNFEGEQWMFLEVEEGLDMEGFTIDGWILDDGEFLFNFQNGDKYHWVAGKPEGQEEEFPQGMIFKNLELNVL